MRSSLLLLLTLVAASACGKGQTAFSGKDKSLSDQESKASADADPDFSVPLQEDVGYEGGMLTFDYLEASSREECLAFLHAVKDRLTPAFGDGVAIDDDIEGREVCSQTYDDFGRPVEGSFQNVWIALPVSVSGRIRLHHTFDDVNACKAALPALAAEFTQAFGDEVVASYCIRHRDVDAGPEAKPFTATITGLPKPAE